MCDANTLENCDTDLVEIAKSLNNVFVDYCDDEDIILSKNCINHFEDDRITKNEKKIIYEKLVNKLCKNATKPVKQKCYSVLCSDDESLKKNKFICDVVKPFNIMDYQIEIFILILLLASVLYFFFYRYKNKKPETPLSIKSKSKIQ